MIGELRGCGPGVCCARATVVRQLELEQAWTEESWNTALGQVQAGES